MSDQKLNELAYEYLTSINPYTTISKAWLGYDYNGYKACYMTPEGRYSQSYLIAHNKEQAVERMIESIEIMK